MAIFEYKATNIEGKILTGTIEGKDENAVISKLQEMQYFPIQIRAKTETSILKKSFSLKDLIRRVKYSDIVNFTNQLATLLNAGIQLDRALAILIDLYSDSPLKPIVEKVRKSVQGGSSFADALSKYPKHFSRLYVNMVRSGETGGVLEIIMSRLAGFLELTQAIREEIISAMIYPIILVSVGGIAIAILLTFVIPKFALIFQEMNVVLPLPTRITMSVAYFIRDYWYIFAGLIVMGILSLKNYQKTEQGKYNVDKIKLKIPLIGKLIFKIQIARFARTLGTLIKSGVPILQSLTIVKETLTNEVIARSLINVYSGVKEGEGIAGPLKESKIFPPLLIHMITVGEETGSLESMLSKVADVYESEVKNTIKRLMSLLEPLMILFMGLLIGFIVVSMLMAIFSITDLPI